MNSKLPDPGSPRRRMYDMAIEMDRQHNYSVGATREADEMSKEVVGGFRAFFGDGKRVKKVGPGLWWIGTGASGATYSDKELIELKKILNGMYPEVDYLCGNVQNVGKK